MAFDSTRVLGPSAPPPSRPTGWWQRIERFLGLGGRAPSAPALPTDRLDRSAGTAALAGLDSAAVSAVARLGQSGQAGGLDIASWQALSAAWSGASIAQQAVITSRLQAGGVAIQPSADGRYVSFVAGGLRVIAEPSSGRLRRCENGRSDCYTGTTLAETITTEDNQATMTLPDGSQQVWDATSGAGSQDGQPILPQTAPLVPGESARVPWAIQPADRLKEPAWSAGTSLISYEPAYDQAILAAGDRVLEPGNPTARAADLYNCHSFATTGGAGDLFDPYLREAQPHWLNNSLYQLSMGSYGLLSADQRVHPGDLVVYKNGDTVTHTGVVRAVDADGNPTQVESKFGILGRYMHAPFDVPGDYGQPAVFFRATGT